MFPSIYRNTSGSSGEREILIRLLPNFHEFFFSLIETRKMFPIFFRKKPKNRIGIITHFIYHQIVDSLNLALLRHCCNQPMTVSDSIDHFYTTSTAPKVAVLCQKRYKFRLKVNKITRTNLADA